MHGSWIALRLWLKLAKNPNSRLIPKTNSSKNTHGCANLPFTSGVLGLRIESGDVARRGRRGDGTDRVVLPFRMRGEKPDRASAG